jgi:glycosyltransferase involved in cell wall biosynthesis
MRCPTLAELPSPPPDKTGWPWTEESPQLPDTMTDGLAWPRISIVTPSYNQGPFIEETIRSVLLQGYPNVEYMIIDGGSRDQSVEIIRKYEPWLSYSVSEADRGQSHAINKGFSRSTGQILTFQNSDDLYLKGTFAEVGGIWPNVQSYGVVAGGFHYIDQWQIRQNMIPALLPSDGPLDLAIAPPGSWRIHQVSAFYMVHALDQVGRHVREDLSYTMDRELLYRVCKQYKVWLSRRAYGAFRWHGKGKTEMQFHRAHFEYVRLLRSYVYRTPEERHLQRVMISYFRTKAFLSYAKYHPGQWKSAVALLSALVYRPGLIRRGNYVRIWLSLLHLESFFQRFTNATARHADV